ncbi:MAG TPA: permease [Paludibacteraceae bacterium]|nr:permease [Paludibacteraceae bacterium]
MTSRKPVASPDKNSRLHLNSRILVFGVIGISIIHTIYMNVMGYSPLNHNSCVVFKSLPKWFFQLYESFIELFVVVILGVFVGVLIERYFNKIKRFYPKNQWLAFLYGAILPVCSCGVLPLIDSMKKRTSLKTIITFIIAAPLLNPYIMVVSFTVLGWKYMVLRIVFSFLLSFLAGWLLEFVSNRYKSFSWGEYQACVSDCDFIPSRDPFIKTTLMTKKLVPYILAAGTLSFIFAIINPKQFLEALNFSLEPWPTIVMTAIGIPLYVCNGTDIIFLKPLMQYTDLSMGSAIAFSLSASAVCVSSIAMLLKFIGKNLTIALVSILIVLIFIFSAVINLFL